MTYWRLLSFQPGEESDSDQDDLEELVASVKMEGESLSELMINLSLH